MAIRFEDPKDVEAKLGKLTLEQLWAIVKIAKHVRLRARNNTAFNNYFNRIFPYAQFKTITKQHADGTTYPGLQITVDGVMVEADDAEA